MNRLLARLAGLFGIMPRPHPRKGWFHTLEVKPRNYADLLADEGVSEGGAEVRRLEVMK